MNTFTLIPYYFSWHYTSAIKNLFKIWRNFIWFVYNFFSISILTRTLFSPFKRLKENYGGGLDIEKWFESVVVTTIMRVVGFCIRFVVITFGLFFVFLMATVGLLLIMIWFLVPFILVTMFVGGLISIF